MTAFQENRLLLELLCGFAQLLPGGFPGQSGHLQAGPGLFQFAVDLVDLKDHLVPGFLDIVFGLLHILALGGQFALLAAPIEELPSEEEPHRAYVVGYQVDVEQLVIAGLEPQVGDVFGLLHTSRTLVTVVERLGIREM